MINHARNLLINPTYTDFNGSILLEELFDPDYVAKTLPSHLLSVRRVLFGEKPDRTMLNFRARQLLTLIHSCELEQYVLDLDPRVTYEFGNEPLIDPNSLDVYVDQFAGSRNDLGIIGEPWSPDRLGQMYFKWAIQYGSGNTTVKLLSPYVETVQAASFTNGLSAPMSLPNSPLQIVHHNVAAQWHLEYTVKPTKDLGDLLVELDNIGGPTMIKLFGVGTALQKTEPMQTFYNLWKGHYALPYRLGAAVLALIYQTNELIK